MGLQVSISSLEKLLKSYFEVQRSEDGKDRSIWIQIEEVGQCGSKYEAHAVINSQYTNQPNLPTWTLTTAPFSRAYSLQTQIMKQGTYNTKREEYLDLVKEEFGAFDPYKLDRIWAIMYDNLRSILKNRGGNDYKQSPNLVATFLLAVVLLGTLGYL